RHREWKRRPRRPPSPIAVRDCRLHASTGQPGAATRSRQAATQSERSYKTSCKKAWKTIGGFQKHCQDAAALITRACDKGRESSRAAVRADGLSWLAIPVQPEGGI